jgi:hypothetical protein
VGLDSEVGSVALFSISCFSGKVYDDGLVVVFAELDGVWSSAMG